MINNSLRLLIDRLYDFYKGDILTLESYLLSNSFIVHYFYQIIRFWNTINYIIKKNLRFINTKYPKEKEISLYFYSVYRIKWEKSSSSVLLNEIKDGEIHFHNNKRSNNFKKFISKLETFSLDIALKNKNEMEKLSIQEAIPTFFLGKLNTVMKLSFLRQNIKEMNKEREISDIRINMLKSSMKNSDVLKNLRNELTKNNEFFLQDDSISYLYYSKNKSNVLDTKWFKEGFLTFQDKGSILIVEILNPKKDDFILDMCAAPGMKTSLIAQKMQNNGKIIVNEFLESRAYDTKQLLKKFNVLNTYLLNSDSISPPFRKCTQFEKILLDAPCTGSGTFQSNPELKMRQNSQFLHQNVLLQEKLIKSAKMFLKPGGQLLYSTCSLYPEEGEFQVINNMQDLIPMTLPDYLSKSYLIEGKPIKGTGRLFPAIHKTNGFFIAKFKKKS